MSYYKPQNPYADYSSPSPSGYPPGGYPPPSSSGSGAAAAIVIVVAVLGLFALIMFAGCAGFLWLASSSKSRQVEPVQMQADAQPWDAQHMIDEQQQLMQEQQEASRRMHEEMMRDMESMRPDFTQDNFGAPPADPFGSSHQDGIDEMMRDSQRQMDESRQRMDQMLEEQRRRSDEMHRQRMEDMRRLQESLDRNRPRPPFGR